MFEIDYVTGGISLKESNGVLRFEKQIFNDLKFEISRKKFSFICGF